MSWFRKTQDPVDRQIREVKKELRRLEAEVRRLQREPAKTVSTFKPAATALPPGYRPNVEEPQPVPPRDPDLWSHQPTTASGGSTSWWRSLFGPRQGPSDPRLVSY